MITVQITHNDGTDNTTDITRTQLYAFDGQTKEQTVEQAERLTEQALSSFRAAVRS